MEQVSREYSTKDFYLACLLRASGFALNRVEKGNDKFSLFVFSDEDGTALDTVDRYWQRTLTIQAKDLVDAIRDMKTILYQTK